MQRLFTSRLTPLILLLAVIACLATDSSAQIDVQRRGFWVVVDDAGELVSMHREFEEASKSAGDWSVSNEGKAAEVIPPRYMVSLKPKGGDEQGPSPEPAEDFTDINWKNSIDLPKDVTIGQIQLALNANRPVRIHAGTEYTGSLILPHSIERLGVHGKGDRPIINVPAGKVGIDLDNDQIAEVTIQGIELRGAPLPYLGTEQGIRVRLSGGKGKFIKSLLIEDCKISGFDDCIQIVDDYARVAAKKDANGKPISPGAQGRITATIRRNIITKAYGSDKHSIGIYIEGTTNSVIEQNTIDWIGWAPGMPEQRNEKGHCIYAQSLNDRIIIRYNWLSRASGNAFQLRAGGDAVGNVMSECSLGPFIAMRKGLVAGNVVLDSTDVIKPPPGKITNKSRGHAYILSAPELTIQRNIAARKGGTMANMRAFESISGTSTLEGNLAVEWAPTNFNVDGTRHRNLGTNRTIDKAPGNLPAYDDKLRDKMLSRPRATWGDEYETPGFIKACWKALD